MHTVLVYRITVTWRGNIVSTQPKQHGAVNIRQLGHVPGRPLCEVVNGHNGSIFFMWKIYAPSKCKMRTRHTFKVRIYVRGK